MGRRPRERNDTSSPSPHEEVSAQVARVRGRLVAFRTFKSLFFRKSHATDQPLFGASDLLPEVTRGLRRA